MRKCMLMLLCITFVFAACESGNVSFSDGNSSSVDSIISSFDDNSSNADSEQTQNFTISTFSEPVSLVYDAVNEYLQAEADTIVTDYLPGGTVRYDKGRPVTFSYEIDAVRDVKSAKIEFSFSEDFSVIEREESFSSSETEIAVYNLQTNKDYYFRITVLLKDGKELVKTGELTTAASPRMISLSGANNVRDIGGWKTECGKTVKQGLLYHGSEIDGAKNRGNPDFRLTSAGIQQLRGLGIKTDFDLRSEEVKVSEYSILGSDVSRTFYNAAQYQSVTEPANAEKTRTIFSDLADPNAYPVYLHCTHGVDRAGSTVLLLEGLLGVAKEDLVRDYELSAFYHSYAHVNRNVENGGNILTLIEKIETYSGETFADKVASFLLSIGVTQAEIDSIRTIFLD